MNIMKVDSGGTVSGKCSYAGSRASELHTALAIEKEESLLEASRVELKQHAKIDNLLGFAGGSMETENSGSGNLFFNSVV